MAAEDSQGQAAEPRHPWTRLEQTRALKVREEHHQR